MLDKIFGGGAADIVKSGGGVLDNLHTYKEEQLEDEKEIKDMILGDAAEMQNNRNKRRKEEKNYES